MTRQKQTRKRIGALNAFELLFLLPILFVILLGLIQISFMLSARARLHTACWEAARQASRHHPQREVLHAACIHLPERARPHLRLAVAVDGREVPPSSSGQPLPLPRGEQVTVHTCVRGDHVCPDLLRFLGYSLQNMEFECYATMRME